MIWQVVVGPRSWESSLWAKVEAEFSRLGLEYELHRTPGESHVQTVVNNARQAGHRHFVAMGGDGAMNIVLNALLAEPWESPPVLGVLPAGTGSDFIRMFAIPQDTVKAVTHLVGDRVYRSDVGSIVGDSGQRYFLNVAQAGIGGQSVIRAEKLRFLGGLRYQVAFWTSLPRFKMPSVTVTAGEKVVEADALMVVVANGQFFGRGYNIAPKATVVDGLADVQIFSVRRRDVPTVFLQVRSGNHLKRPDVRRLRTKSVEIATKSPTPVEADGEYLGSTPITVSILPEMIDFKF